MKQFEAKEKKIGGDVFYIRPFPALTAANISGDLAAVAMPLLGSLAPLAVKVKSGKDLLDMSGEEAAPVMAEAAAGLSGAKIESLLKKLLISHKNISVQAESAGQPEILTEDLLNELFCGDIQHMFVLAFEVIKINYSGFFKKLGSQFGIAFGQRTTVQPSMSNSVT